ncbi:pentatricopeptide repeat-containing protein At3g29290 [Impatiens glandulifera]|uniref:pentatricopeptide repeat-containing protein At3g29290 n=1 Tax=Impatiens glandulifera TaxID=253017 RepID=UPI001FB161FE|nr:pentatricopeptide repeat-containing protein At3g29290 [Impatiens glandulifera]
MAELLRNSLTIPGSSCGGGGGYSFPHYPTTTTFNFKTLVPSRRRLARINAQSSLVITSEDSKSGGLNHSSTELIKLHYLEERDEEILSRRILNLSRLNKVTSAVELYRSMQFSDLRPNSHACNSLIASLLRNQMLDSALTIFESMRTSDLISSHTCSLVLKAVSNARGFDAALHMFNDLESQVDVRKIFDPIVYNTMISVCSKSNKWVQAERIWRLVANSNTCIATSLTYRLLICTFVRCGQNELAIDAYEEMIRHKLDPTEDVMHAVIGACSREEGKWELGLNVFQRMLDDGMKPTIVDCNSLINALGKHGEVKRAFRIYQAMKSDVIGHKPDAYTWNGLLGGLYKANRHGEVIKLFQRIKDDEEEENNNNVINSHLYNTCLMSCQRLGLWDKSLQLLWEMETSGFQISTATYNLVIGACEVARKPKVALQVYERMMDQKCEPDMFTLSSMVRICVWGSMWIEVEQIIKSVVGSNNGDWSSLYNIAIQGVCLRGKSDMATKMYIKMRKSGLEPDGKTRALMLQILKDKTKLSEVVSSSSVS